MKTVRKKRLLNRVTRKQILGKGREGTVYNAVNSNNIHYALKEGTFGRHEIEFATTVAVKYPNQFMQLYDHRDGVALWSKIDMTFREYSNKKHHTHLYDFYIQIFYIVSLLQKEGWTHNDFHTSNIGLCKTTDSIININGTAIPTHGYYVQAIDYGSVRHTVQPARDLYKLFSVVQQDGKWIDMHDIKRVKFSSNKLKQYLPALSGQEGIWIRNDCLVLLLGLLNFPQFRKLYPSMKISFELPRHTMLYIIKHLDDVDACLDYLIEKRRT
jgi:hypothetical protein